MNSLETDNNYRKSKETYPQIVNLFKALNIPESDKKNIQAEFSRIADMIYGNPQKISGDTMLRIKLWQTNPDSFVIVNQYESVIVSEYFDFIHWHPHWEKIWRTLSAYYDPSQL